MADDNIQYDDALSQFTYDDAYIFDDDRAQHVVDEVLNVCLVYDSDDWFTIFVQLFLAFAALMSLWIKRQNEIPKRKFRTWFLDCSKQGVGAVYAHICNMAIAAVIVNQGAIENNTLNDQCAWYGITYLVDTTLGLVLAIWGLKLIDYIANEWDWTSLKHSGVYEGVNGLVHWINQVVAWLVIMTVAKVIIYYFMIFFGDWLAHVGAILFLPLQGNIRVELLFVMILFPGVLNVIYFWIADHYLKAGTEHAGAYKPQTLDAELAKKAAELLPPGESEHAFV